MILVAITFLALQTPAPSVTGVWEGESICQVHPSPCHDEHVIGTIKATDHAFTMDLDKVVNGERENMGALSCSQPSSSKLVCQIRDDVRWDFDLTGDQISGKLIHRGQLYRLIHLKRLAK